MERTPTAVRIPAAGELGVLSNPKVSALDGSVAVNPVYPASMGTLDYYYPPPGTTQFSLGVPAADRAGGSRAGAVRGIGGLEPVGSAGDQYAAAERSDPPAGVTKGADANLYRQYPGICGHYAG